MMNSNYITHQGQQFAQHFNLSADQVLKIERNHSHEKASQLCTRGGRDPPVMDRLRAVYKFLITGPVALWRTC